MIRHADHHPHPSPHQPDASFHACDDHGDHVYDVDGWTHEPCASKIPIINDLFLAWMIQFIPFIQPSSHPTNPSSHRSSTARVRHHAHTMHAYNINMMDEPPNSPRIYFFRSLPFSFVIHDEHTLSTHSPYVTWCVCDVMHAHDMLLIHARCALLIIIFLFDSFVLSRRWMNINDHPHTISAYHHEHSSTRMYPSLCLSVHAVRGHVITNFVALFFHRAHSSNSHSHTCIYFCPIIVHSHVYARTLFRHLCSSLIMITITLRSICACMFARFMFVAVTSWNVTFALFEWKQPPINFCRDHFEHVFDTLVTVTSALDQLARPFLITHSRSSPFLICFWWFWARFARAHAARPTVTFVWA